MELVDPRFYHLDTCFCPLNQDEAIYYPGAFDDYGRSVLRDRVAQLIEVSADEAASFSCNAVVVNRTVVLNNVDQAGEIASNRRLRADSGPFDRVHQVRRQRQVPDDPARRRGSRRLETNANIGSLDVK